MRQTRLVLMAVGGLGFLCVLALVVTLSDYTSRPTVAVAHVPPVVRSPNSDSASPAPSPEPTTPVATVPTPTASPTPPERVRGQGRHHRPPGG